MLPRDIHNDLHALGYNDAWREFFDKGRAKKTQEQIHNFARELAGSDMFKEYFQIGAAIACPRKLDHW